LAPQAVAAQGPRGLEPNAFTTRLLTLPAKMP